MFTDPPNDRKTRDGQVNLDQRLRMRRQCVPGSLFSAYEREPGDVIVLSIGPTRPVLPAMKRLYTKMAKADYITERHYFDTL